MTANGFRPFFISSCTNSTNMKYFLAIALALLTGTAVFSQTEISKEADGTKIVKGFINKGDLLADSSFAWFRQNGAGFTPQAAAVEAFRKNKDSFNMVVFGGTWCSDTKSLLPKFYGLADAARYSNDRITLIGVDRSKKTIHHLSEAFNVTHVPTFIVMKNGVEVGRVVEYGKYGSIDRELGEIVSKAMGK